MGFRIFGTTLKLFKTIITCAVDIAYGEDEMELFGFIIPLWAVFLGVIVIVVIAWKLIKFALKVLLVIVVFFVILIGLDLLNVFKIIQDFLLGVM
jgi:hypothetical protein